MSRNSTAFAEWGNEQCKRLVAPVPFSSPRCFFPTASVSFKKNSFRLLVVFHVSLCSSSFSICALRFSLSIRLPFFWACPKIFPLFAPFFSPFLCRSDCLAHVLPRVCLVFGFFVLFFRFLIVLQEMKIYSLLTMKNEKRRNPSRFSFTFAVEQFNLKTKQSFILKHTML